MLSAPDGHSTRPRLFDVMPRRAGASDSEFFQEVPGWNVVTPPPTVTGLGSTDVPHPTACPCGPNGPILVGQTPNGPKPSGSAPGPARSPARCPPRATRSRTTTRRPDPEPITRPDGGSRPR